MIRNLLLLIFACSALETVTSQQFMGASHSAFHYMGRTDRSNPACVRFDWPGTTVRFAATGTSLTLHLKSGPDDYYNIRVNNQLHTVLHTATDTAFVLQNLPADGFNQIEIAKRTEADFGVAAFYGITLSSRGEMSPPAQIPLHKIEFIGNSISCGYGTEGASASERFRPETENNWKSYAPITARALNAEYTIVAHSGIGMVRNYNDPLKSSVKLATMPMRFDRTLDSEPSLKWDFNRWRPDVVVVNLGTNDYSTLPHPDKAWFQKVYARLIDRIKELYGNIPVVCISGPMIQAPCMAIVKEVVDDYNGRHADSKIYFLAIPEGLLNAEKDFGSDWHPNYRGNKKTAQLLVPFIAQILNWDSNDQEYRNLD